MRERRRHDLDGHWRKHKEIAKVESESSNKKAELVFLGRGGRLPGMQVAKGCHADSATNPNQREVGWEHLPLQIPKLMPRQIPTK